MTHTYEVERELGTLLSLLRDVETGVRGFVISGEESFLGHYRKSQGSGDGQLRKIKELTADNSKQQQQLPELARLVDAKLAFSSDVVVRARDQGLEAGRQLISSAKGLRGMDSIRALIAKMQDEEDRLLALRQAKSEATDHAALWISGGLAMSTLALLFGAYFLTRFHLAERRQAEEELDRYFTLSLDILAIASADGYWKRVNPWFARATVSRVCASG